MRNWMTRRQCCERRFKGETGRGHLLALGALAFGFLAAACSAGGDREAEAEKRNVIDSARVTEVGGPGVLTGRILLEGTAPPSRRIQVNKDVDHCRQAEREVLDIVVSENNELAGVVIEIQGIRNKGDRTWSQPPEGYVIRQSDCRFQPHVLVAPPGADLSIYNDDPITHNINTGQWNVAQGPGEDPVERKIRGRGFVRVNCNIHSWMEAWIYVAQSPYWAETGKDGKFRIEGIPPGSYRVTASHPDLATERFHTEVGSGQIVEREVTFSAP